MSPRADGPEMNPITACLLSELSCENGKKFISLGETRSVYDNNDVLKLFPISRDFIN